MKSLSLTFHHNSTIILRSVTLCMFYLLVLFLHRTDCEQLMELSAYDDTDIITWLWNIIQLPSVMQRSMTIACRWWNVIEKSTEFSRLLHISSDTSVWCHILYTWHQRLGWNVQNSTAFRKYSLYLLKRSGSCTSLLSWGLQQPQRHSWPWTLRLHIWSKLQSVCWTCINSYADVVQTSVAPFWLNDVYEAVAYASHLPLDLKISVSLSVTARVLTMVDIAPCVWVKCSADV